VTSLGPLVARWGGPAIAALALRSTVLLLATAGVCRLLARSSAAQRHLIWRLALLALLLLIPVAVFSPPLQLHSQLATAWTGQGSGVPGSPAVRLSGGLAALPGDVPGSNRLVAREGGSPLPPLVVIWAIGTLLLLARDVIARIRIARLLHGAEPVTNAGILEDLQRTAAQLGIRWPVRMFRSTEVGIPAGCGVLRPALLLPHAYESWNAPRRRRVLTHELAHLRRRDPLHTLVGELAVALFWWHPLARYAALRLRQESELACDDQVLRGGSRASEYAEDLLAVARGSGLRRASAISGGVLQQRIDALFEERRRAEPGRLSVGIALVGAILLLWLTGTTRLMASSLPAASTDELAHPAQDLPRREPQQLRWSAERDAGGMFVEGPVDLLALIHDRPFLGPGGLFLSFHHAPDGRLSYLAAWEEGDEVRIAAEGTDPSIAPVQALVRRLAPDWRDHPDTFIGALNADPAVASAPVEDTSGSVILGVPGSSRNPDTGAFQAGWYDRGERIGAFVRGPILSRPDGSIRVEPGGWLAAFAWNRETRRLRVLTATPGGTEFRDDGIRRPLDRALLLRILERLPKRHSRSGLLSWE